VRTLSLCLLASALSLLGGVGLFWFVGFLVLRFPCLIAPLLKALFMSSRTEGGPGAARLGALGLAGTADWAARVGGADSSTLEDSTPAKTATPMTGPGPTLMVAVTRGGGGGVAGVAVVRVPRCRSGFHSSRIAPSMGQTDRHAPQLMQALSSIATNLVPFTFGPSPQWTHSVGGTPGCSRRCLRRRRRQRCRTPEWHGGEADAAAHGRIPHCPGAFATDAQRQDWRRKTARHHRLATREVAIRGCRDYLCNGHCGNGNCPFAF
jgi:hypothetical protein